jgi:hypothetical protein
MNSSGGGDDVSDISSSGSQPAFGIDNQGGAGDEYG